MKTFVASFECTTCLSVPEISGIEAATAPYALDAHRCLDVSDHVRENGRMPEGVLDVVQAYATGEHDDWERGELKAFVRVSTFVLAESEEDAEDVDVPDALLREVYRRMGLSTDVDAEFVLADVSTLEDFEPREPGDKEKLVARAAGYAADAPSI